MVDLTIIIVSWNCRALIEECLATIPRSHTAITVEVVIVDNDSADDTVTMLRERFPQVRLILNDANVGFARACNQAIEIAQGRYIMLFNPDAKLVTVNLLDLLIGYMDQHPAVGAAGCELVFAEGQIQVSAGFRPTPWSLFAFCFFLAKLTHDRIRGLCLTPDFRRGPMEIDVDWVCGAGMIVRREAWLDAGVFDERFHLYGEDIEWGCRIHEHGWRVVHLNYLKIEHELGGTQKQFVAIPSRWINGFAQVYMEIDPGRSWLFFKACFALGLAMRTLAYSMLALLRRDAWSNRRAKEMFTWLGYLLRFKYRALATRTDHVAATRTGVV